MQVLAGGLNYHHSVTTPGYRLHHVDGERVFQLDLIPDTPLMIELGHSVVVSITRQQLDTLFSHCEEWLAMLARAERGTYYIGVDVHCHSLPQMPVTIGDEELAGAVRVEQLTIRGSRQHFFCLLPYKRDGGVQPMVMSSLFDGQVVPILRQLGILPAPTTP